MNKSNRRRLRTARSRRRPVTLSSKRSQRVPFNPPEILIKPQISGIVRRVQVEAGELVESGQVLAEVMVVPTWER